MKSQLEALRKTEADLRAQLAGIGGSRRSEIESLKGDKAALEGAA